MYNLSFDEKQMHYLFDFICNLSPQYFSTDFIETEKPVMKNNSMKRIRICIIYYAYCIIINILLTFSNSGKPKLYVCAWFVIAKRWRQGKLRIILFYFLESID